MRGDLVRSFDTTPNRNYWPATCDYVVMAAAASNRPLMADQMTVAFIEQTGHMLGALTAVGQLGKLTPAEVAGDVMPVRFETTSMTVTTAKPFAIPATELNVEALGFHRRVFEEPRDAQVTYTTPPDKDPVLGFVSDGNHWQVELTAGAAIHREVQYRERGR